MKKSTRAIPAQSVARKARSASARTSSVTSGGSGAGILSVVCPAPYLVS